MRVTRRVLGMAAAGRGADVRGGGCGADAADGGRSEARGAHGRDAGSRSRCRWSSSTTTTSSCSRRPTGQVKRIRNGGAPEVVLDLAGQLELRARAARHHARQGLQAQRHGVPVLERDARRPPTATAGDAVPLLGNRLDRFHWDGSHADLREDDPPQPRLPGGRDQPHRHAGRAALPRQPQRRRRCASARTARSTCRSATPVVAARRRTCSTARSARASRTTSSAARTSSTITSRA